MLWIKTFHIVFVVVWFSGIFYLPRLFIYHATATDAAGNERFKVMERRLFAMMTLGAVMALAFGIAMLIVVPGYLLIGWMHAKLALVALLLVQHFMCWRLMIAFRHDRNTRSPLWLRVFNEVIPVSTLIGIVVLVVI
ncbi:MAG: CopD family protein, partial [Candidatus Obscuribacterales bacterium]|nr:CopD family protein [Steroidobacteraceae bacterium]